MGLFDKIKNSVVTKTQETVNTPQPPQDNRPYAPNEVLAHQQHECIKVNGTSYHQDVIKTFVGDTVEVAILKDKIPEWNSYPVVNASDGVMLGAVSDEQLEKAGLKKGYTAIAEIHRPIYKGQEYYSLYLPKTKEALDRAKYLESLKLWVNLDASKWLGGDGERFDYFEVEVITSNHDAKKPTFVILGDNSKLFEVNSRMKMYQDIAERTNYKPRRLIVEKKIGKNGFYYRVGFYY